MTTTTTLEPPVRREWVVPALPSGDPAAVRAVARALRELESGVRARQRSAEAVLAGLRRSAWRGGAAMSAAGPIEQLGRDAQRVASALEAAAGELERYAHRLEEAHRHHGWSWKKIAAVAGAVVVGAGVVALTAGLAAPEVAMIEAEVVAAGAAASGAAAAEASAAVALGEAISLVRGVQALTRFVVPRLYVGSVALPSWAATPLGGAAVGASTAAAMDYAEFGSVDARDVVFSALLGYAEGASTYGLRPVAPAASTQSIALRVAAEFDATVEPAKNGWKVTIPVGRRELVLRVMERNNDRRGQYWRLSVAGKQTFTSDGSTTDDASRTHIELDDNASEDLIRLIRKVMQEGL